MKLTKLLTGAGVAALLTAGAASAQVVTYDFAVTGYGTPAGNGTYYLASELDLAAAEPTTTLNVLVSDSSDDDDTSGNLDTTANDFGTGDAVLVVNMPGFVLDSNLASTGQLGAGGAGACDYSITDGGAAGDSSVTFLISDIETCNVAEDDLSSLPAATSDGDGQITLPALPVVFVGPTGNISTTLTRASTGSPIDGGTVTYDGNGAAAGAPVLVSALPSVSTYFSAANTGNVEAELPDYETLDGNAFGALTVDIGRALTTAGYYAVNDSFGNASATAGNIVAGDLSGITFTATFEDTDGLDLDATTLNGTANGDVTGSSVEFDVTPANANYPVAIFEDATTPAAISAQLVLGAFDIDFAAITDLGDKTATDLVGQITREGVTVGPFEWVGDADAANFSVFRLTGFDPDEPIPTIRVEFNNEAVELAEDEIILDTSGLEVSSGGELILTSRILGEQAGDYGRADVSFFFETSGISIDRFIASGNGTLSTWDGDFANTCSGTVAEGAFTTDLDDNTANGVAGDADDLVISQANSGVSMTCSIQ